MNTISGIASAGRGWVSTGRRFYHGVVGATTQHNVFLAPPKKALRPFCADPGSTAEVAAIQSEIIYELLKHGAVVKGNGLRLAVRQGSLQLFEDILEHVIDVNYAGGNSNETALMAAAEGNKVDVIEALMQHNASIDQQDKYGKTALHKAAFKGSSEAVLTLLHHNASATIKTRYGRTPLMVAAKEGRTEVVQVLLSNIDVSSVEKSRALGKFFLTC